jgi:hypothetical protein
MPYRVNQREVLSRCPYRIIYDATTATKRFGVCNRIEAYRGELCHVAHAQEDLGVEKIRVVFRHLL